MIALIGVRISWDMWARNVLLARLDSSAACLALSSSRVRSRTTVSRSSRLFVTSSSARLRTVMSLAIPRAIFRPMNLTGYVLSSTLTSEPSLRRRTSSSGPVGLPMTFRLRIEAALGTWSKGRRPAVSRFNPTSSLFA